MKEIKFVDVGEGITEGHVRKWLVKDGETVKEDQPVVQVETDKAVVNVPAPVSGLIKQNVPENSNVHVGDTIAYIGEASELQSAATKPAAPQQQVPETQNMSVKAREVMATPAVRKLARDLGVDVSKINGTGPEGRIIENDIRSVAHGEVLQSRPIPKFSEVLEEQHEGEVERIPLSQVRKAIAKNMEAAWTIPHAAHMDLIDATDLFDVVQKEKQKVQEEFGVNLTFTPFIIKAVLEVLKENPRFNASYDHEKLEIIQKKYYHIGLAVGSPSGLKVVVLKDVDKKSIIDIAKESHDLSDKARNETITLDEMRDSTFTISNIGSLKAGFFSVPVINYPEVAILGIHMIRDMPVVKDGKIVIRKILPYSLVFDHRVVDGAEAVKFGNSLAKYLEDPDFLEMLG